MSFNAVFDRAPLTYIRERLGADLCGLLDLIEGGAEREAPIRAVAAIAIDAERLVAVPGSPSQFLALLLGSKRSEFAQRLGRPNGVEEPSVYLNRMEVLG